MVITSLSVPGRHLQCKARVIENNLNNNNSSLINANSNNNDNTKNESITNGQTKEKQQHSKDSNDKSGTASACSGGGGGGSCSSTTTLTSSSSSNQLRPKGHAKSASVSGRSCNSAYAPELSPIDSSSALLTDTNTTPRPRFANNCFVWFHFRFFFFLVFHLLLSLTEYCVRECLYMIFFHFLLNFFQFYIYYIFVVHQKMH